MPETQDLDRLRREYDNRRLRLAGSDMYSPFNVANLFIIQQRQRAVLKQLRRHGFFPLENRRVLELGCGAGGILLEFLNFGASASTLHGTELLLDRVQIARARVSNLPLTCADGQDLPYARDSFDLSMQFTVFSSILDDTIRARLAGEMLRVTRPGGMILWYDFWLNPVNRQTMGMRPAEVRRLFPDCNLEFHKVTLAPPLARRLVPFSWGIALFLETLRLFNSHYLVLISPKIESSL